MTVAMRQSGTAETKRQLARARYLPELRHKARTVAPW